MIFFVEMFIDHLDIRVRRLLEHFKYFAPGKFVSTLYNISNITTAIVHMKLCA